VATTAHAHAPIPSYNWKEKQAQAFPNLSTITNIDLLRCEEKIVLDPQTHRPQVVPGKWICKTEVSAVAVTYTPGKQSAKVKKTKIDASEEIIKAQPVEDEH
jgi:hypothetical protein